MSRIPAGTWCADCWVRDHRCQAQLTVDERPLCLPCADGEPCSVMRVAATAPSEQQKEDMWGEPLPEPAVIFTPEQIAEQQRRAGQFAADRAAAKARSIELSRTRDAERSAARLKPVAARTPPTWHAVQAVQAVQAAVAESEETMERKGIRVTGELVEKVIAEIGTATVAQLALKYQVHISSIYAWMKQRGIATKKAKSVPAAKPAKKAAARTALVRRSIEVSDRAPAGIDAFLRGGDGTKIHLELSAAAAVNIFSAFSYEQKQIALKAVFEGLAG